MPARLTLARLAVASGKPADAIAHLQRVLKDQSRNTTAALMLAELHAGGHRYDQAIAVLEATARGGSEVSVTLALANLYIRTGRFDDAVARLAPLLKENPNFVQARLLTGQAQLGKHDVAGAIASSRRSSTSTQNSPTLTITWDARCEPVGMSTVPRGRTSGPSSSRRRPNRSRSSWRP